MKKISLLLIIPILLLSIAISFASGPLDDDSIVVFVPPGSICDDCSGDLVFAWHSENITITEGTPCGCTDAGGDTVVNLNGGGSAATLSSGWAFDGTNSLYIATDDTFAQIDNANSVLDGLMTEAKVVLIVRLVGFNANAEMFQIDNSSGDSFYLYMRNLSTAVQFRVSDSGGDYITTADNYDLDTNGPRIIRFTIEWLRETAGNDFGMTTEYWNGSSWSASQSVTEDDDLVAATSANAGAIKMGCDDTSTPDAEFYIDGVWIYNDTSFD